MGLEIERKFLVHKHQLPSMAEGIKMIQGYLSEKPSVRFRIMENSVVMTVKEYYPSGERFELETPSKRITAEEISKLQELAVSHPIVKVRYSINHGGLLWEVDVYQEENEGLITVDVELPKMDYSIDFPAWVDVNREITFDARFNNLQLGRNPFTKWGDEN